MVYIFAVLGNLSHILCSYCINLSSQHSLIKVILHNLLVSQVWVGFWGISAFVRRFFNLMRENQIMQQKKCHCIKVTLLIALLKFNEKHTLCPENVFWRHTQVFYVNYSLQWSFSPALIGNGVRRGRAHWAAVLKARKHAHFLVEARKAASGFVDADSCVQTGRTGEHDGENRVGDVG